MKILNLTLKRKWFEMIQSGLKTEEYREIKPYWDTRIGSKNNTHIKFRWGYGTSAPSFVIELVGIYKGVGKKEWGAPKDRVYVLKLGKIKK